MANRDLFRGADVFDTRREPNGQPPLQSWSRRLLLQTLAALLLFCGVVYLYEQESALGEGVRYIVALASAEDQEIMAVSSFTDFWQGLWSTVEKDNPPDNEADQQAQNEPDNNEQSIDPAAVATLGDNAAVLYQPDEAYLAAAQTDNAGNVVMILPASGLMQSAFGDIDDQGLTVAGVKIFCQNKQEVKAAAIGEVITVVSGEKVVLRHRDGLESCYLGAIEPAVKVGDTLRQGQLLGYINENTLLFQVLQEGEARDPFLFLQGPE